MARAAAAKTRQITSAMRNEFEKFAIGENKLYGHSRSSEMELSNRLFFINIYQQPSLRYFLLVDLEQSFKSEGLVSGLV